LSTEGKGFTISQLFVGPPANSADKIQIGGRISVVIDEPVVLFHFHLSIPSQYLFKIVQ